MAQMDPTIPTEPAPAYGQQAPMQPQEGASRLDGVADKAISGGINASRNLGNAWTNRNSDNPEERNNAWNYVCSFMGGSACLTLVLNQIIALFHVLTMWFWIQLPVSLVLIFLLFVFELPQLFQHVLTLCGNHSEFFVNLQKKADSMVASTQTRGFIYIVMSILIISIWRQLVWGAIFAIICGVLHIYIYRKVNGKSEQPPQPTIV